MSREPKTHALLIGIDDYATRPLVGCANDVEDVERWLIDTTRIAQADIEKLVAPGLPSGEPLARPTLLGIRAAFERLAGDVVGANDRVFIYYSGHGFREVDGAEGQRSAREALVPVDAVNGDAAELLWDVELNGLLRGIAVRGAHITFVLDCCHAGGVTREARRPRAGLRLGEKRGLSRRDLPKSFAPPPLGGEATARIGVGATTDAWAVVVACQDHEVAREAVVASTGRVNGLFTRALLEALPTERERAAVVRWHEVLPCVTDAIRVLNSRQHPTEYRAWSRPVLGGPSQTRDFGFAVWRSGAQDYRIGAGLIHGLDVGAVVGVYPAGPAFFPALGSAADLALREGLLVVVSADRTTAKAIVRAGNPIDVDNQSRARIVEQPEAARLPVRGPTRDPVITEALNCSTLLRWAAPGEAADVWIKRHKHGFSFGDDLYDSVDPTSMRGLPTIRGSSAAVAREVLEHYARYSALLRLVRRADLASRLTIDLLDCNNEANFRSALALDPAASVVAVGGEGAVLQHGGRYAIRITNDYERELQVGLFWMTILGRVDLLGKFAVPANGQVTCWRNDARTPFEVTVDDDRASAQERVVAIGTTLEDAEFNSFIVADEFFTEPIPVRGTIHLTAKKGVNPPKPPERWTGTVREVLIRRP